MNTPEGAVNIVQELVWPMSVELFATVHLCIKAVSGHV